MRNLRCPKCSTAIQVPDGTKPVCSNCGFGGPNPKSAATTAKGPASAKPAAARPVPGQPGAPGAAKAPVAFAAKPATSFTARPAAPAAAPAPSPFLPEPDAPSFEASTFGAPAATTFSAQPGFSAQPSGASFTRSQAKPPASKKAWIIAGSLAAVLVVAGLGAAAFFVFGKDGDGKSASVAPEDARGHAEQAILAMAGADDLRDLELNKMTMSGSFDDPDVGKVSVQMTWELGTGGDERAVMNIKAGILSVDMTVVCKGGTVVLVVAGEAYEQHPTALGADSGMCPSDTTSEEEEEEGEDFGMGLGPDGFPWEDLETLDGVENFTATTGSDGSVTASFTMEDGDVSFTVAPNGQVRLVELKSEEGTMRIELSYGKPIAIALPQADERSPAAVSCWDWAFGGSWEGDCEGDGAYDLRDFEVRVIDSDENVVQTFPFTQSPRTVNGMTFTFEDNGDGLFGDGDVISVEGLADDHDVLVWDIWADRDLEDDPALMPGPAPMLLLAGLALLVAVRRRRSS